MTEKNLEKRAEWLMKMAGWAPEKLVFLDETGLKTNLVRLYGRAPCGERLDALAPCGRWHTTTFICALRHHSLSAPMAIDGAMNGVTFVAYIEQVLAPTLKPGDIVILDNLSSHKSAEARAAVEKMGAQLELLPPYSPDFNPIENVFSKLKSLARGACHRTVEALWKFAGEVLDEFSPGECENYLRHCGYTQKEPVLA